MCLSRWSSSHRVLAASLLFIAAAAGMPQLASAADAEQGTSIRPFKVKVPESELMELRNRLGATRWPDRETVGDPSQGAQLAKLQDLVRYWGTEYDWRKAEVKLNALPMYVTTIDGVDVQFIHVRSRHANALPLIITHGWPGSIIEQLKIVDPLVNPTAHGGRAEDAFDVVIPSLPGYGFSGKPVDTGWGPDRIGSAWAVLMQRLGYSRYVAQGGDWGSPVAQAMGRQAPPGLLGIHVNLPAAVPGELVPLIGAGAPPPPGLSDKERATFEALKAFNKMGNLAYVTMLGARPQAVGYGLTDSPAGLAGFMLVHPGFAKWSYGSNPTQSPTRDDVLDNFTLYWLTNSATSAARLYWEGASRGVTNSAAQRTNEISVPVAVTSFPDEVYQPPESWARKAFRNLIYFHEAERGGHFAAWEEPEIFAAELRSAFSSLRDAQR
ncbi:MAG: Epoxide hydrolase domain protein [Ramlibacter sp.]|nr:Epoxide hydrolase domain protein [Ramlibacter sp.]